MKLNVGCGAWPLPRWINVDLMAGSYADIQADGMALPFLDGSLEEVYAGHLLEHLTQEEADAFLQECSRVLKPGGKLGVVVPDTREILKRYIAGPTTKLEFLTEQKWYSTDNLDDICAAFLYSTIQPSQHKWSYDIDTLKRRLERSGFRCEVEINRWFDRRITVGAWYQCGWQAVKEA